MAEMMAVEAIIEADWLLQGFWTKPRFAFQADPRGWSDIDVLAYSPESRHLVFAESKVKGTKDIVYAFTSRHAATTDILAWDDDNYFQFLRHIGKLCEPGVIFSNFKDMVQKLTVQLVSNYFVSADVKDAAVATVTTRIKKEIPKTVQLDVMLDTTMDVFCRVIRTEKEKGQGRRYGHPMIDLARELNRYLAPSVNGVGRDSEAVRDALVQELRAIINGIDDE